MVHITYDGTMKLAYMKRIIIFQMILNFIELAIATVPVDPTIQKIKDNYTNMTLQTRGRLPDVTDVGNAR